MIGGEMLTNSHKLKKFCHHNLTGILNKTSPNKIGILIKTLKIKENYMKNDIAIKSTTPQPNNTFSSFHTPGARLFDNQFPSTILVFALPISYFNMPKTIQIFTVKISLYKDFEFFLSILEVEFQRIYYHYYFCFKHKYNAYLVYIIKVKNKENKYAIKYRSKYGLVKTF